MIDSIRKYLIRVANNNFLMNQLFWFIKCVLRMVLGNTFFKHVSRINIKRLEWLYLKATIPNYRLHEPAPTTFLAGAAREALVTDLLDSFHAAIALDADNSNYSNIWSLNIRLNSGQLLSMLQSRDHAALSRYLDRMFQQSCLRGITTADYFKPPQRAPFLTSTILETLVSLAEYLGVVRAECPEQGQIGYAFHRGADALVLDIEKALGFNIDFPHFAGSYGILFGGRLITGESPEHIYAAHRLKTYLARHTSCINPRVLEIGAGYGGTAYWFTKCVNSKQHVIYDLALTNVYQGWFLSNVLGRDNVALFSDVLNYGSLGDRKACVLPVNSGKYLNDQKFDCIMNENSLPEMPENIVVDYLRLIHELSPGIFFSYNQEAYSPVGGVPQVWIPEMVRKHGGFHIQSRERSWIRRGYVEEVYKMK